MATKKAETADKPDTVEAAVLCDCVFGKVGDVVQLTKSDAENGKAIGVLDTTPAAIKAIKG